MNPEQTARLGHAREEESSGSSGPVDLRTHLKSIRRFWKSVVLIAVLVTATAIVLTLRAPEKYQSTIVFFASSSVDKASTALAADEFAQRRINSYVGVVSSERMANIIRADTGLGLSNKAISEMITASADPDTVLLNVNVEDVSPQRSLTVAKSIADNLDLAVGDLDNRGTTSGSTVQLHVISGPTLNNYPVSPKKKLNVAIGLLLGLGLAIGQALTRQQLDTTVRSGKQLSEATGRPTLGEFKRSRQQRSSPILTLDSGQSRSAESYRQLRTNLRFVDAARPVQVLVVTSSLAGEGKTTVAANLALSFAETGRTVLLIDADLRRPRLETYLDLEASVGLTDVLIGEAPAGDVTQTLGSHGLHVLASGLIPPNPAELLGSSAMEKFIEESRSLYEMIIIDTPPLLPVTDAAVTANLADGTIVVVRHGHTRIDQIRYAIEALEAVDARVLGTVLSLAPRTRLDDKQMYYQDSGAQRRRHPSDSADTPAAAAESARSTSND